MLNQIFSHTPLFVWALLAFFIVRGVIALRTREVSMKKLFIMPIVLLIMSLFDIQAKFGLGGIGMATWLCATVATMALLTKFGAARVTPAPTPGHVIVRGSVWPLVLMMSIFVTKYVTSVAVAIKPQLRQDTLFTVAVCTLFGVFTGIFAGRLAHDLKAYRVSGCQSAVALQAI